jgi:hypothetical protein
MQFRKGEYFMHKNALDVCLLINNVVAIGHDSVTLNVVMINLGYTGCPWVIEMSDKYTIAQKEYDNYVRLPQDILYKPRTKPGIL